MRLGVQKKIIKYETSSTNTPAQTAKRLVIRFGTKPGIRGYDNIEGKRLSLVCVEEILDDKEDALDVMQDDRDISLVNSSMLYWQDVEKEIEKL